MSLESAPISVTPASPPQIGKKGLKPIEDEKGRKDKKGKILKYVLGECKGKNKKLSDANKPKPQAATRSDGPAAMVTPLNPNQQPSGGASPASDPNQSPFGPQQQ